MPDTIELRQVLSEMRERVPGGDPKPFQVSFITADRKTRKGGEVIDLPAAVIFQKNDTQPAAAGPSSRRAPRHRENRTINFYAPGPQRYFKAHVDLLLTFNGKWIIW